MGSWLRRIRGAMVMGVLWAFGWALLSIPMELFIDPDGRIADIWPMVLAMPGFIAGTFFAIVLAATERQRQFEELSLGRTLTWGVIAGALLGSGVVALLAGPTSPPLWQMAAFIAGPITVLSAASAAGTLAIARKGEGRELPPGDGGS